MVPLTLPATHQTSSYLEPSRSSSLARAMSPLWLPLVILLVLENGPSLAATGHHVINCAGVFDPQWSGHGPRLPPWGPSRKPKPSREGAPGGLNRASGFPFPL